MTNPQGRSAWVSLLVVPLPLQLELSRTPSENPIAPARQLMAIETGAEPSSLIHRGI
jgi:hypothetical protein